MLPHQSSSSWKHCLQFTVPQHATAHVGCAWIHSLPVWEVQDTRGRAVHKRKAVLTICKAKTQQSHLERWPHLLCWLNVMLPGNLIWKDAAVSRFKLLPAMPLHSPAGSLRRQTELILGRVCTSEEGKSLPQLAASVTFLDTGKSSVTSKQICKMWHLSKGTDPVKVNSQRQHTKLWISSYMWWQLYL